jgi:hypothetical protein
MWSGAFEIRHKVHAFEIRHKVHGPLTAILLHLHKNRTLVTVLYIAAQAFSALCALDAVLIGFFSVRIRPGFQVPFLLVMKCRERRLLYVRKFVAGHAATIVHAPTGGVRSVSRSSRGVVHCLGHVLDMCMLAKMSSRCLYCCGCRLSGPEGVEKHRGRGAGSGRGTAPQHHACVAQPWLGSPRRGRGAGAGRHRHRQKRSRPLGLLGGSHGL